MMRFSPAFTRACCGRRRLILAALERRREVAPMLLGVAAQRDGRIARQRRVLWLRENAEAELITFDAAEARLAGEPMRRRIEFRDAVPDGHVRVVLQIAGPERPVWWDVEVPDV